MWTPGAPVTPTTPLEPILCAIGFVQQDVQSYTAIADKLKARSVNTVGELFGSGATWEREELIVCLRPLGLKKSVLAYIGAIEAAVGSTVGMELDEPTSLAAPRR